jgi:short-subunit dehydrogenase
MLAQGSGQIINMSSVLGKHTMPFFTPYAISKHGLDAFGQGLRRELRGTGIRVLTVLAGFVDTGMVGEGEAVLRGYGVWIMPPEFLARRVIEALLLRKPEAHIYRIEAFAIWCGRFAPRFADFLWGLLAPPDLKEIASRRQTD